MQENLQILINQAQTAITQAQDLITLEQIRLQFFGKKGQLTEILKGLAKLSPEHRIEVGQVVNTAKQMLLESLETQKKHLQFEQLQAKLKDETIDISLPGRGQSLGSLHPVTRIREQVEQLFVSMGFTVVEGPEIENEYYNFEALNIPSHHPARAMHDTFYLGEDLLLRTHTSPVQIRAMQTMLPPLKIITPGRVYRCDSDQTHTPMFHQLEGLVVDETCNFANLKNILQNFLNQLFERDLEFRFRPSYFPFTEPSAEVDIRLSSESRWLEILGCGMVHPQVLTNVGIDSERYNGFAFGIGLDRLAMLRYGINDLRKLFEGDLKFLEQF